MKIDFYEKPGCINNTKQKQLLENHGHTVTAHSLLTEVWTKETLRPFFGTMPVNIWFNMSAPMIKNGDINPNSYTEETALAAMIKEPLLIRRPLISVETEKACGFDNELVNRLLNNSDVSHVQKCPNIHNSCD